MSSLPPSRTRPLSSRRPLITAVVVAVVGVCLTGGLWLLLDRLEQRVAERQLALVAEQAALRLEDYVASRLLALQLVVHEVGAPDAQPREDDFSHVAQHVLTQFDGFQAVNWIDDDGVLRWVVPGEGNEAAKGQVIFDHPSGAGAFARRAHTTGLPVAAPPIDLYQGGRGFTTYLPVRDGEATLGMVNGVFRIRPLVEDCFSHALLDDYALRLVDEDAPAFVSPDFAEVAERGLGAAELQIVDRTWTLELAPKDPVWAVIRRGNAPLPALGLAVSVALALLVFAWGRDEELRRTARTERARLEAELQRSRRLETIGRLAGGIAHDFNNLLTVVSAHAELARMRSGGVIDDHLDAIDAAGERAAALTRQLLAYGGNEPKPAAGVEIDRHLGDLVGLLRRLVRDDVTVTFEAGADRHLVRLHPEQLGQIVLNLVVNASDAMPQGGRVEVWTRVGPVEEGLQLELGVRDEGEGIDEAVRERLFEPFFTTKGDRGTGMGLATVAELVESAGGQIEVSSVRGGGTTFQVHLPCHPPLEQLVPSPPRAPERRHAEQGPDRWQVLVVDDEPLVLAAVERGLTRAGLEVVTAPNGRAALELVRDGLAPDVVVSDQVMPEMGGVELARALRERHPDLPVVLCSGYAAGSPEERRQLREQGIRFVEKPFQVHELASLCRKLARRTHEARAGSAAS